MRFCFLLTIFTLLTYAVALAVPTSTTPPPGYFEQGINQNQNQTTNPVVQMTLNFERFGEGSYVGPGEVIQRSNFLAKHEIPVIIYCYPESSLGNIGNLHKIGETPAKNNEYCVTLNNKQPRQHYTQLGYSLWN